MDSGNFVASLHVLRSGLTELIDRPAIDPACWGGFADVARLFLDACRGHGRVSLPGDEDDGDAEATAKRPGERVRLPAELAGRLEQLAAECERGGPAKLSGAKLLLQNLSIAASEASAAVAGPGEGEPKRWAAEMSAQIRHFAEELHHLCPWVDLVGPGTAPAGRGAPVGVDAAARQRQRLVEQALIELENYPTLRRVADLLDEVVPAAERLRDDLQNATLRPHADFPYHERAARILRDSAERSRDRIAALRDLAGRCTPLIECDWSLLYDRGRHLLHIGYNCAERRADAGYYDLLASEMRLGSFALVATGVAPQEHWFRLGRQTTLSPGGHPTLLSWSGSMFEYLMPLLMMPQHAGTLLDETCQGVVARQREYARDNGIKRGVPWGVSESGYSATDAALTYQYRPFGVPGLGYKRGLGEDLVIAPYATMMAAMVDPTAAAANLRRLRDEGRMGRHGFFEAVDYTPARVKRGRSSATVRQYMAHHQAMGLLGLAAVLLDGQPGPVQPGGASTLPARAPGVLEGPMQRRLMSSAAFRSAELLLHERVPRSAAPAFPHAGEHAGSRRGDPRAAGTLRIFTSVDDLQTPEVHLLSNGRLSVMVTAAGGGYARWDAGEGDALAVTRWQEDATRDARGSFAYVRDVDTGEFWGTTRQPVPREPLRYEAIFSQARAEFRRVDALRGPARQAKTEVDGSATGQSTPVTSALAGQDEVETYTQVSVSPEDDVEVRRVTVTNNGRRARTLELTSYAEVVLAPPAADAAHPAFQNLFVQTRLVRGRQAILARRRARQPGERTPYLVHLVACYGDEVGEPQYETDRAAFVGRGRSLADPAAMHAERLGDSSGSVLDSIASVRRAVRLEPGEKATFDVVTGVADTNEAAHALIEKYHDRRLCDRVGELAWTHSQILLRQLGIDEADAQAYGRLAGSVIHATPQRRAPADVIARNLEANRKQSNLWAYGISGDLPIVLVRVGDLSRAKLVEEAVRAHAYWRRKGLRCDLVVWNEDSGGYRGETHDAILAAIARAGEDDLLDRPGGVFVRRVEQFAEADRNLVLALARVVLSDKAGPLAEQVGGPKRGKTRPAAPPLVVQPRRKLAASAAAAEADPAAELRSRPGLLFRNGLGGFTPDGKEYVVTIAPETPTPAPWSNVIANDDFGTLVTESGGGYTWRTNAREFRLTPFYNDPVTDVSGEALYVRDEETGRFWSPTPLPARGAMHYTARHGFGYSVFEYAEAGIASELAVFVHRDDPVKLMSLKLHNQTDRRRRVSATAFVEWVLTDQRDEGATHVSTGVDADTGAVFARNPYNADFGDRVAFLACSLGGESQRTVTGDRAEFIGRHRSAADPAAMGRAHLSGRVGSGLDPCAAVMAPIDLGPGEERTIVFALGAGDDEAHARRLCARHAGAAEARRSLQAVWEFWGRTLGTLYVDTPDPAVNVLANGWLEYQTLACRYWGRTGYYQSGGAYGFRDQLQDTAALLWCRPEATREHLLRSAARQFKEGDVLHWWHPPADAVGVRTHFSDDYMWLPLLTARYVNATGDTGVLDETAPFLEGPPVPHDQESIYQSFGRAEGGPGTLYEHCRRAILNGVERRGYGRNGLPLMGCGDWNDGMNLVGDEGRGESVWLAWFFILTLLDFAKVADRRGDGEFAERCRREAETLRANAEENAWDGEWYRRAYFDDGRPLGSRTNGECQIDSLPQSWAVLCGLAQPERAASGMAAVRERLVRPEKRLIQLFDPPFDDGDLEPGYIKGYVPGVRENGGQYTHAAVWTVMAMAEMAREEDRRQETGDRQRPESGSDRLPSPVSCLQSAWSLFDLVNPVNHAATPEGMATYKVEPYVVAADVYGVKPHVGRGGWTWYTGSAGWMYRLIIESLLGLTLRFEDGQPRLYVEPLLPEGWDGFGFTYRHRDTHHHVRVRRRGAGTAVRALRVDGTLERDRFLRLRDDGRPHEVEVDVGAG